jgi:hypothetical protein
MLMQSVYDIRRTSRLRDVLDQFVLQSEAVQANQTSNSLDKSGGKTKDAAPDPTLGTGLRDAIDRQEIQ